MFPDTSTLLRQGHARESSVNSSVIRRPNPNRATIDRPCKLAYEGIPPRPADNSCRAWHASFLFYMMKGVLPSSVVGPGRSPHPLQSVLLNRERVKMSSSSMFDIKPINDPSSHDEIILFLVSQRGAKVEKSDQIFPKLFHRGSTSSRTSRAPRPSTSAHMDTRKLAVKCLQHCAEKSTFPTLP